MALEASNTSYTPGQRILSDFQKLDTARICSICYYCNVAVLAVTCINKTFAGIDFMAAIFLANHFCQQLWGMNFSFWVELKLCTFRLFYTHRMTYHDLYVKNASVWTLQDSESN